MNQFRQKPLPWSPGRGLNPRPRPYQGRALPLSYPGPNPSSDSATPKPYGAGDGTRTLPAAGRPRPSSTNQELHVLNISRPLPLFKNFSRFRASARDAHRSEKMRSNGTRERVERLYPLLCSFNRLSKSLVIPMYNQPSFQLRSAYTNHMERETGLEPATIGLEGRHSTTELLPHRKLDGSTRFSCRTGLAFPRQKSGGRGRVRTYVGRKARQIYSLLPLTTRPPVRSGMHPPRLPRSRDSEPPKLYGGKIKRIDAAPVKPLRNTPLRIQNL